MPILSNMEKRGALSTAREWLITVVRLRFGEAAPELVASINSLQDLPLLKKLLERAVITNSLEEFKELLNSELALEPEQS